MHDEFPGPSIPVPTPARTKKVNYKEVVKSSDFAVGDALIHLFWAGVKQPIRSIIGVMGTASLFASLGPFIAGFGGFAAAPNAHFTQKMANGASLYIARPVVNGIVMAATEATLREQNQIANPSNTGTLTAQQVKALRSWNASNTRVQYVVNRK